MILNDDYEFLINEFCNDLSVNREDALLALSIEKIRFRKIFKNKRNGGYRILYSPSVDAKLVQIWLTKKILNSFDTGKYAFAYRKNISVINNVFEHTKKLYCLKFDIKDFFPSISFNMLKEVLEDNVSDMSVDFQGNKKAIYEIIKRYCFLTDGSLAQGFCSSPMISNIVMSKVDSKIIEILNEITSDFTYTRYADDITISFNQLEYRPEIYNAIFNFFKNKKNKFKLNTEKNRFGKRLSGSMMINGFKVCHNGRITLHRKYKDYIRERIYCLSKGILKDSEKESLKGHLFYIKSVDALYHNKIVTKYFSTLENLISDMNDYQLSMWNVAFPNKKSK